MKARFITITAPVYWASALINGDDSGLSPEDREDMAIYLAREQLEHADFVDCGEPRFTWNGDLYGSRYRGCEVTDYTVIVRE